MEKYKIIEEIGKGSYGSVSKIQRISTDQTQAPKFYCWKEINYGHLSDKERAQVVSEINCLERLNHPNIVRYKERIQVKDQRKIYIVMEYCDNGDMAQLIKKCKAEKDFVAEDVIWKIFMQILQALRECHYRGIKGSKILHRDLKPSNVFFDSNNNVKLGDFGLSRIIKSESSDKNEAMAQTNVGTPYYMSPEQINECEYDEKTDIWSLGCVIYELVSLIPPFTAGNHLALAQKILAGKIERIPERYSEDLQEVIQQMLNVDSSKRPSVEELIKLPKIKLRINERKLRDQYGKLKYKEQKLEKRAEELKQKTQQLDQREKHLQEKEARIKELYLKQVEQLEMFKKMQTQSQQNFSKKQLNSKLNLLFNSQNIPQQENEDNSSFYGNNVIMIQNEKSLNQSKNSFKMNVNELNSSSANTKSFASFQVNNYLQQNSEMSADQQQPMRLGIPQPQNNNQKIVTTNSQVLKSHESLKEQIRLMKQNLVKSQQKHSPNNGGNPCVSSLQKFRLQNSAIQNNSKPTPSLHNKQFFSDIGK